MVAVPRRKPSVVRRAMSWILPLKILAPPSTSSTASTGSRWARRAACTARPIPMALVVEPRMAHSLISLPVRGALQVEATEPTSTQALRLMRSIHFQLAAPDLERHHGPELPAEILLHHGDGERHGLGIGEALLAHQRGAHVGAHRH